MSLTELNLSELIKAYEIVKSENPAGDYQVQRGTALGFVRRILIDHLVDESKKWEK